MTSREFVMSVMMEMGKTVARQLQLDAPQMSGTEIVKMENFIPDFNPTKQYLDYAPGYVCKTPRGNIVKLLQPYDSLTHMEEPEELEAQWGFYWSTDPAAAKPFVKLATSPYAKGDCCLYDGHVYRSKIDINVYSPEEYIAGWEDLGTVEEMMT